MAAGGVGGGGCPSFLHSTHSTQAQGAKGQGAPLRTPTHRAPALAGVGWASSQALGPSTT